MDIITQELRKMEGCRREPLICSDTATLLLRDILDGRLGTKAERASLIRLAKRYWAQPEAQAVRKAANGILAGVPNPAVHSLFGPVIGARKL